MSRIITLLSDFRSTDGYVAAMKGMILRINPRISLIDISHEIGAHDVLAGAFVLGSVYSYFPAGTIHLAVVDPGVGGRRRAIILETPTGYFVGPDNGILTLVLRNETVLQVVAIENPRFMAPVLSRTFHGRDLFAPAAAYLSLGAPVAQFGPAFDGDPVQAFPNPRVNDSSVEGEIVHVDIFGNLITNISADLIHRLAGGKNCEIWVANCQIAGFYETYENAREGEVFAVFGGTGLLEISVKEKSAGERLGLGRGAVVRVIRAADSREEE